MCVCVCLCVFVRVLCAFVRVWMLMEMCVHLCGCIYVPDIEMRIFESQEVVPEVDVGLDNSSNDDVIVGIVGGSNGGSQTHLLASKTNWMMSGQKRNFLLEKLENSWLDVDWGGAPDRLMPMLIE